MVTTAQCMLIIIKVRINLIYKDSAFQLLVIMYFFHFLSPSLSPFLSLYIIPCSHLLAVCFHTVYPDHAPNQLEM